MKLIRQAFQKKKLVHEKSCDTDLVTETDQGVEKLLIQRVKENFPTHKYWWSWMFSLMETNFLFDPKIHWGGICGCRRKMLTHWWSNMDYRSSWRYHELRSFISSLLHFSCSHVQ